MNLPDLPILPDWKWGTAEGSRDLDRLLDRRLTFREKIEWLEEAETLSLRLQAARDKARRGETPAPKRRTERDEPSDGPPPSRPTSFQG